MRLKFKIVLYVGVRSWYSTISRRVFVIKSDAKKEEGGWIPRVYSQNSLSKSLISLKHTVFTTNNDRQSVVGI